MNGWWIAAALALSGCASATHATPTVATRTGLASSEWIEAATEFEGPVCVTVQHATRHCFMEFSERMQWALSGPRRSGDGAHSALIVERVWLVDDAPTPVATLSGRRGVALGQRVRVRWTMQHFDRSGRSLGRVTNEDTGSVVHWGHDAPSAALASAIEAVADHALREFRSVSR